MPSTPVQQARYAEPDAVVHAVAGIAMDITPLPAAPFQLDTTVIGLDDVVLTRVGCSPLMMLGTVATDGMLVHVPLTGADTLLLNGMPVPVFGLALHGPGARVLRANPQPSRYAMLRVALATAEAALPCAAPLLAEASGRSAVLSADPANWSRMARLFNAASDLADETPDIFATEPPRAALRATLLGVARRLLEGSRAAGAMPRVGGPPAWRRIVLGAEEYLGTHLDRPIYTEELCEALGVSAAGLSDAFRATLTMSPHRYLKLRRLGMVRAALMRRDGPPPLVKSVALSHGFWHLGQFARDYRETFGETPSETLAHAHDTPASAEADQDSTAGARPG